MGRFFSIKYNKDYSGTAKIRIIEIIRGSYEGCYVEYSWSKSPHSRDIDRAAQRYFVFMRSEGGEYVSSVHGAGVWEVYLNLDDYNKSVVKNDFIKNLPREIFENADVASTDRKMTLNSIRNYFKSEDQRSCSEI